MNLPQCDYNTIVNACSNNNGFNPRYIASGGSCILGDADAMGDGYFYSPSLQGLTNCISDVQKGLNSGSVGYTCDNNTNSSPLCYNYPVPPSNSQENYSYSQPWKKPNAYLNLNNTWNVQQTYNL
jgi:hypothetical protein